MAVVIVSVVAALAGACATRAFLDRLAPDAERDTHAYWALGLVGLVPGWLVAAVALLGSRADVKPGLAAALAFALSTAFAVLGAIIGESFVRRPAEAGEPLSPRDAWRIGALSLAPAWLIALVGEAIHAATC